jgi:hypothetical protein
VIRVARFYDFVVPKNYGSFSGIAVGDALRCCELPGLMCVRQTKTAFQARATAMNDTTTTPTANAIQVQLQRLDWFTPVPKKRVAKAAEQMLCRAQRAGEDATA